MSPPQRPTRPARLLSLRGQGVALLSRREHSGSELRQKLLAHARRRVLAGLPATGPAPEASAADPARPVADDFELAFLRPALPLPPDLPPPDDEALAAAVDDTLAWLVAHQYLSDTRFMECRVHARASRHGTARIRQELARHGLRLDADTLQQLRDTEHARAREVWLRRFGAAADSPQERARQMRFLAARGFAADVVRRVVGGDDE